MYRNYVVAHILVKVSEWTQLDVVTKVDIFPKVNSLNQMMIKHEIKDKRAILKYGSLVNDIMRLMEADGS